MHRFVLAAALTFAAAVPAAGQTARALPPLVFDDLGYAAAEWSSQRDRAASERSVFGLNPWCDGLACADTVMARTWYRYLWRERGFDVSDPLARIEPDTSGTGGLTFALLAGAHEGRWPHQLASGFSARTGVWAARVDFSALPDDGTRMIQAFWLVGSHQAVKPPDLGPYRGASKGRFEVDFEFTNWFGRAEGTDVYLSTGIYENAEQGTSVPLRAGAGAAPYSCALTERSGRTRTASPAECAQFLTADGVWATLLFRSDGEAAQFEILAQGPAGALRAVSDVEQGSVPTQTMVTMISQHFNGTRATPNRGRLSRDHRFTVDWVYWSPEADRSLSDVRADVAQIQAARVDGRRVRRLRTAPVRLHRPYTDAPGQPFGLRPDTPLAVRVAGPEQLDVLRRGTFVAQLDEFVGTFRIEWSRRPVSRDGTVGAWSDPVTDVSHVWAVRMPLAVACVDVRARATPMTYTVVDDGGERIVEWVPPDTEAPSALSDTRRVCKPWAPPSVRRP